MTEDLNLLEPNYMSGLDGGITRKQYETIKQIADVEVAAPIAMIGNYNTMLKRRRTISKIKAFIRSREEHTDTGLKKEIETTSSFVGAGWFLQRGTD